MPAYAIVRSGGKQYRVQEGDTIDIERLAAVEGGRVELPEVLLLVEDGRVMVGTPTVPDAKVVAEVVLHGRGPKVTVFKYKAKTRYRRKTGHRQGFTRLAIQRIQVGEGEEPPPEAGPPRAEARRRRPRKSLAAEPAVSEAVGEEPAAGEAAAPEPEGEKKPAPRRRRKTAETTPTGE